MGIELLISRLPALTKITNVLLLENDIHALTLPKLKKCTYILSLTIRGLSIESNQWQTDS